jgi:SAM-dependent methyltransferase
MTLLAAKPGISGRAALIVGDDRDAVRAQSAAAEAGILIEAHVTRERFPFDDGSFDVAILHGEAIGHEERAIMFRECFRTLRTGGRVIVFERGTRRGLAALFQVQRGPAIDAAGTPTALEDAGFHSVRLLGDLEGFRFTEGLRTKP